VTTGSEAAKPANPVKTNPENLSTKGKAKAETAKPANADEVITGFGVGLSGSERKSPTRVPSTSFCEPFREAIELGLSRGRNAMAIWQDLVSESGFRGGYQTVKRFVRKLHGVRAGDKGSHFGRFRPKPVVHPREPPVDGDAVRTLQQFLN
jgi:hypothetical protein